MVGTGRAGVIFFCFCFFFFFSSAARCMDRQHRPVYVEKASMSLNCIRRSLSLSFASHTVLCVALPHSLRTVLGLARSQSSPCTPPSYLELPNARDNKSPILREKFRPYSPVL